MRETLQYEAERVRYTLRSSFCYRKAGQWFDLLRVLSDWESHPLDWSGREDWGISVQAWNRVDRADVPAIQVFCHPRLIAREPRLVAYYRMMAVLPQKGAIRLGFGTASAEAGRVRELTARQAEGIAAMLNRLISLLIESDPHWCLETAHTAALLTLGAQVDGSWKNAIGTEGSKRVKDLLVSYFLEGGHVAKFLGADGSEREATGGEAADAGGFVTRDGYTFRFGSEPDVAIYDPGDTLAVTIEVKYGLDPAGALERYGAAKKSFEHATRQNRRVHNIYLASCLTEEVLRRIREDRLVNYEWNLTEVLEDAERRQEFLARLTSLLH